MFGCIHKRLNSDLSQPNMAFHPSAGAKIYFFHVCNTLLKHFLSRTLSCYCPLMHPVLYRSCKSAVVCKDGFHGPSERESF